MSTEAVRTVRDRLPDFVDRAQKQHKRVVDTRNGTPAVVLVRSDELVDQGGAWAFLATCTPTPGP